MSTMRGEFRGRQGDRWGAGSRTCRGLKTRATWARVPGRRHPQANVPGSMGVATALGRTKLSPLGRLAAAIAGASLLAVPEGAQAGDGPAPRVPPGFVVEKAAAD